MVVLALDIQAVCHFLLFLLQIILLKVTCLINGEITHWSLLKVDVIEESKSDSTTIWNCPRALRLQATLIPQSKTSYFPPYELQSLTPILPSSYVSLHVFPPSATLARYSSISPSQCAWSWLAEWRATCQSLRSTKLRKETSSPPPLLPPPPPTNNQMHLARFLPRTPPHHHHLHSSFILPYVHIADL